MVIMDGLGYELNIEPWQRHQTLSEGIHNSSSLVHIERCRTVKVVYTLYA